MITTDKVIEIFCIADDFCAEYENGQIQLANAILFFCDEENN